MFYDHPAYKRESFLLFVIDFAFMVCYAVRRIKL